MAIGDSASHIADLVDGLLAAQKELAGEPVWRRGNRPDEDRLDWPVLISGETSECRVSVTAYPTSPDLRFTITLNYRGYNIWRVDHEPDDRI